MKTAIQFGAGNIGRGFIGMLLARAGYKVVFADVNAELIDRLHQDKQYTVHIMDVEKEDVPIDHVDGVLSTGEEIIDEIAKASLITTAVGLTILPRIAPTFAQGIIRRKEEGCKEYLNIIACENAIRGTSQLKEHVYQSLNEEEKAYADEFVGFADCAVDRIVPPGKNEIPTDVVVEQYHEWDVEKGQIKGELPEIAGMTLVDNLDAYIERKLFTLNTGHCITAYVGRRKGYSTIEEAIGDKEIYELVFKAMTQSGAGLVKKHG
ncbi:MAG: mannitol-1-phosphate 5-dehydrogenase, partial [Lachnospiraceae bacterium]|nr:mannitol-1-phosphate 5-dehydrogenase [Lachnospiraceae bacterium]